MEWNVIIFWCREINYTLHEKEFYWNDKRNIGKNDNLIIKTTKIYTWNPNLSGYVDEK